MSEILPTYIGNCRIEETERSDIEVDAYGLDTYTQVYQGWKKRVEVERFRKALKAAASNLNIADASWRDVITPRPHFSVIGHSFHTDRSWAHFTVRFRGKEDGNDPPPQTEHSLVTHTIDVDVFFFSTVVTSPMEIDYIAPARTHRYATREKPTKPRFTAAPYLRNSVQIIAKRGGGLLQNSNLALSRIEQRTYMTEFECREVGLWWECEEEYEIRLVQDIPGFEQPVTL